MIHFTETSFDLDHLQQFVICLNELVHNPSCRMCEIIAGSCRPGARRYVRRAARVPRRRRAGASFLHWRRMPHVRGRDQQVGRQRRVRQVQLQRIVMRRASAKRDSFSMLIVMRRAKEKREYYLFNIFKQKNASSFQVIRTP